MTAKPIGFYDGATFTHTPVVVRRCVWCGEPISSEEAADEFCIECAALSDEMPHDTGLIAGLPDIRHEDFEEFPVGGTD